MRRMDEAGSARFLTFSCYRRLPLFNNDRIKNRFVDAFIKAAEKHAMPVLAWVIMPEHTHLILVPNDDQTRRPFLQSIKQAVSRDVLGYWHKHASKILPRLTAANGELHFWQVGGGYDRNVVDKELLEKIRYVHLNPVNRGLCEQPIDWQWSSARRYHDLDDAIGPPIGFDLIPPHTDDLT